MNIPSFPLSIPGLPQRDVVRPQIPFRTKPAATLMGGPGLGTLEERLQALGNAARLAKQSGSMIADAEAGVPARRDPMLEQPPASASAPAPGAKPPPGIDPKAPVAPASTGSMALPKIPGNKTGMLIPGHAPGSSIWVPGSEPPMRPQGGPPIGGAMPAAAAQAGAAAPSAGAMVQRPGGRAAPLSAMDMMGKGHRPPPSMDGPQPVGRPMDDPDRAAGRLGRLARSTGNVGLQFNLLQRADGQVARQAGMDYASERDAAQHQRALEMFGMEQNARDARDARQADQQSQMWDKNQAAMRERDATDFVQQMTMFGLNQGADAMEVERRRQQEEQDRLRVPQIGTVAVPGTDYVIPTADGRAMGTLPVTRPPGPIPEGMVPKQTKVNGTTYVNPKQAKQERPNIQWQNGRPYHITVDEQGNPQVRRLNIIDANGDGIDDRTQGGAAGAAAKPSSFLNF